MTDPVERILEYRLHWMAASPMDADSASASGDPVGAWIGSNDPHAIRRYVLSQGWPPRTAMTLVVCDRHEPTTPIASVTCGAPEVEAWSPANTLLPAPDTTIAHPASRRTAKLALMRDLSMAFEDAVAAGVLARSEGDALLILVRDAVESRRTAGTRPG